MTTSKQEKIDTFLKRLDSLVEIKYQMCLEKDRCNHYYVIKTLAPEYETSKNLLRESLEELLDNN